jgi:hypothetical protein
MARRDRKAGDDPRWDRKQGQPKDRQMKKVVERSSGRYSASEQSEKDRPSQSPRPIKR